MVRDYSNSAMAVRRIVVLAVIGGVLGCIRAVTSGMFMIDIFLALMHIPLGAVIVIGLIYGARSIFGMFRGAAGLLSGRGLHVDLMPREISFRGCLAWLIMIALFVLVLLVLIKVISMAILVIGVIVGCVLSVIDLMRAENEDNNTYNNNI